MRNLVQDLRYAARTLLKSPGFTLVAVLTLALGIGANTAIFSYINSLFLRPLPVDKPQELVRIYGEGERRFDTVSFPNFTDLQRNVSAFAEAAAHQSVTVSLGTGDTPETARGELVSGTYFSMLRVKPALGRMLTVDDDRSEGAHPQVVISDGLWRTRFAAAEDVVGRTIHINSHPFTVVGVAPAWFHGSYDAFPADFWTPLSMYEQVRPRGLSIQRRGWGWLNATARLKPGVTLAQASAEVAAQTTEMRAKNFVDKDGGFRLEPAQAMPEQFRKDAMKGLSAFLLVVGLVLLVACANIASVVLTRVTARRKEIAIRQSLGASRGRLLQQWLVESLLLALLGGVAGLVAAVWFSDAILLLAPPNSGGFSPRASLDFSVLGFTLILSLLTGLLFGVLPAMRAARLHPAAFLKDGAATGEGGRSRLFSGFVAGQVAISMALLVVAGLLLQSLRNSETFNPGFDTRGLALGYVDLNRHGLRGERGRQVFEEVVAALRQQPGVESATYANVVPLGSDRESLGFDIPGHTPPADRKYFSIATCVVGSSYFSTMKIPLLLGREFDKRDAQPNASPVIVINETMARRYWPDKNPVGEVIQMLGTPRIPLQIIGVARDIKYYSLGETPMPYIYGSSSQQPLANATFHVRFSNGPGNPRMIGTVVAQVVPGVDVREAMTFAELRRIPLFQQRAIASVTGLFGTLALALTAIGIYGIVSYTVNLRTREMGVRMALGAAPQDIYRLVFSHELKVMGIGVALGVFAAGAAARALAGMLFGIGATNLPTYIAVSVMILAAGILACWIPARRAAHVDPVTALRNE